MGGVMPESVKAGAVEAEAGARAMHAKRRTVELWRLGPRADADSRGQPMSTHLIDQDCGKRDTNVEYMCMTLRSKGSTFKWARGACSPPAARAVRRIRGSLNLIRG